MKPIGLIEEKRLANIPPRHRPEHEFCFHLHDLMARLLVQMEVKRAGDISFKLESEEDRRLLASGVSIMDFLEQTGRGDLERRLAINHMCLALFSDTLHFIYEGLIALEKRKFSVAFALLRKPFKEGMLMAAQMCADEADFFERMKHDAKNLLNRKSLREPEIKAVLGAALKACRSSNFTTADMIYRTVFDRKDDAGLAQLFDKAMHLVTEFRDIQTENYNINFIFKNPEDNDVYQTIYPQLAMLLLFLNMMQIELYARMQPRNEKYQNWMIFTSIASYEALFNKGRSRMVAFVNSSFKEFLICPACSANIRLKKTDAPRLFIAETLDCGVCFMSHQFPFGWLLSKLNVDLFGG